MKLSGEQISQIVRIAEEVLSLGDLERLTRFNLSRKLEHISIGNDLPAHIFAVVTWAEDRDKIEDFISYFEKEFPPEGRRLREIVARRNPQPVTANDPLAWYFPSREPVVDRHTLDQKLQVLWQAGGAGVLVVAGPRETGRSHSWWRIHAAANQEGICARHIDISKEPGEWTVSMLVERIARWLDVPLDDLADFAAQDSRLSSSFLGALDRRLAEQPHRRLCLVLDGFDRSGVGKELCDFVERLAGEVVSRNLGNLSLIMLGYGSLSGLTFSSNILEEAVAPLCRQDVRDFFADMTKAVGVKVTNDEVEAAADAVMSGFSGQLSRPQMIELNRRVKEQSQKLLKRSGS